MRSSVRSIGRFVCAVPAALLLCPGEDRVLAESQFESNVLIKLSDIETLLRQPPKTQRTAINYADSAIESVLFTPSEIDESVKALGKRISRDYEGEEVIVVGLLTGVYMFMGDLVREITIPHKIDFMAVSSYGLSSVSSANVKIKKDMGMPVAGKNVLIVDEICDSGRTMACLKKLLEDRGAKVKTCVLLDKKARRAVDIAPDYIGLDCPDEFVVGYGMDFADFGRSLPYVGVLKKSEYM